MSLLSRTVFWAMLPLALPQALLVRRRAPRFPVAEGPMTGQCGEGRALRLVGIGDSVIAGVGAGTTDRTAVARTAGVLAQRLACRVEWRALGLVGAHAGDVKRDVLPAVGPEPVDLWLVSVGVNDVTAPSRSRTWRRRLDALLAALDEHSPDSLVVLLGVPPMGSFPLLPWPLRSLLRLRSAGFDRIGAEVAARRGVIHAPYAPTLRAEQFSADGYHPSSDGHRDIAADVAERSAPLLRSRVSAEN